MSTTDDVYRIATDQLGTRGVADVNLTADDCGVLTLVAVEFADGGVMVISPEGDGYSFVSYTAAEYDEQPLAERVFSTDGDATLDSLPAKIRLHAQ